MNVTETSIPEVKIYTPCVYTDERGFFLESFNQKHFEQQFVQDNHSRSSQGVLRGLHYQIKRPQGKLVRAVKGSILDVAVDIRKSSPTFGQWVSVILSEENFKQIWVPPGFAHGFVTLTSQAEVLYKTTEYWIKDYDRSIRWNDPDLNIDWYAMDYPLLSNKDANAPLLKEAELFD